MPAMEIGINFGWELKLPEELLSIYKMIQGYK
jgi:hypothetical protein